ncbi:MAG: AAA family ATPase [Solirubrobacterales bacterium]|nr:AAA family ATPase [Solirubrobacterales bacterium]
MTEGPPRAQRGLGLLGRDSECALLDELVAQVRCGASRSLLLWGEAGIGKTALLRYVIESATDMSVIRAIGVESEMELAFAGLHQLCAPVLDRLDRLPLPQRQALETVFGRSAGPPPDRFLVALGILTLFSEAAAERPLLCIVDDAQWLDQSSALILAFVSRRLLAEPVGIVVAAREPHEELQHIASLEVRGLATTDARGLLGSVLRVTLDERVRDRLIAETGGNPLALLELPQNFSASRLAGGFGVPEAGGVTGRIEQSFVNRLERLPDDTRQMLLLAAVEPVGDPLLLWRASERLGIRLEAAEPAEQDGLVTIAERVTFRHPLVRSAVYRAASVENRRTAHRAVAEATDREADPERRAWHLAAAAAQPDEEVAAALERSAGRAQARGGLAAAAAFLQRSVALTVDPGRRATRALTAAQTSLQAGAFDAALGLAATAETGSLDELERAQVDLLRARIAFASTRGGVATSSLLRAAKRLEPLDPRLARMSYLEVLSAALFAARLAEPGSGPREVATAVQAAPPASAPRTGADLLLDGWAALFADGCVVAAPTLKEALKKFGDGTAAADSLHLLWLVDITAPVVWDDARWEVLSERHLELARTRGALGELPLALNSRSYVHLFRGELGPASALIDEAGAAIEATGASLTPWGAIALAVLRGGVHDASATLDAATVEATGRGEGISLTVIAWARAVLYNGLGVPDKAFAAALEAIDCPTNSAAAVWAMVELIEAGAGLGELEAAGQAARGFAEIADAAGTDWALGVKARSQALVNTGAMAEQLYRDGLDYLERGRMRLDLARSHLLYGEWLRREHRRTDARAHLRAAYDMFMSMGVGGFTERARRELLATGVHVDTRIEETRGDLTAQERQIAGLARDGLSNQEIGARLFLSQHTVAYHLRKVFDKLGIHSRRELAAALPSSKSELAPA